MNKILVLFFLCLSFKSYSQGSGLIAHWDMNGSVNDVSGNGNNGHANNIMPAAGMYGIPNTAYAFNGINSSITVPYSPSFNLTHYSICAILNVQGFYSSLCQGNAVINRGADGAIGSWELTFDDNAYNNCYTLDTTKEVFHATAGTNVPSLASDWQYTPSISENSWYRVIASYDGTI